MKQPLDIRFIRLEPSDAIESAARRKAEKLNSFRADIMACRVMVELVSKHQHQGRAFAVRIDLTVCGGEMSVNRVQHEDVYVALREAFDDMARQLQNSVQRLQGRQKLHPTPLHGEVARFADEGRCGFIRSTDGDEYWFGPDNVTGIPFNHLELGTQVQFIPEVAAQGRQAKRVSVGKHSLA